MLYPSVKDVPGGGFKVGRFTTIRNKGGLATGRAKVVGVYKKPDGRYIVHIEGYGGATTSVVFDPVKDKNKWYFGITGDFKPLPTPLDSNRRYDSVSTPISAADEI